MKPPAGILAGSLATTRHDSMLSLAKILDKAVLWTAGRGFTFIDYDFTGETFADEKTHELASDAMARQASHAVAGA